MTQASLKRVEAALSIADALTVRANRAADFDEIEFLARLATRRVLWRSPDLKDSDRLRAAVSAELMRLITRG